MRRDWDLSAFGHRLEPPPPADEDVGATPVTAGQVYRWLGADISIDEVAEDGSGARITVRQPGVNHPWQKWQPLPFSWMADAELISDPVAAVQAAAAEIAGLP